LHLFNCGFKRAAKELAATDGVAGSGNVPGALALDEVLDLAAVSSLLAQDTAPYFKLREWLKEDPRFPTGCFPPDFDKELFRTILNDTTKKSFKEPFCILNDEFADRLGLPARERELIRDYESLSPRDLVLLNRFLVTILLDGGVDRAAWKLRNSPKLMELGILTKD